MATIPPFDWRVPLRNDKPAGPQQINDLAVDIAATVEETRALLAALGLSGLRVEARTVVKTSTAGGWVNISFGKAFAAPPVVVAVPGDSVGIPGSSAQYVGTVTATHFDYGGVSPSTSVRVNYIAVGAQS